MADAADVNVDDLRRRARRRLIGAIVLAVAAAIFVPILLETEPKPLGENIAVKIPPVDDGKFVNRLNDKGATRLPPAVVEPADAGKDGAVRDSAKSGGSTAPAPKKSLSEAEQRVLAPAARPATKAEPAAAATPAPPPKAEVAAGPKATPAPKAEAPPVVAKAEPAAPTKTTPAAAAAPAMDGFAVQLAAFADDKGANALANKLKRAGYPAYTEPLATSSRTLWRVRVGPYPSRDAAGSVRDQLKGDGYNGIVAPVK